MNPKSTSDRVWTLLLVVSFENPNSKRSALRSPLTDPTSKGTNGEAQVQLHCDSKLAQQKATVEAPREKKLLKF